jgi:hypothetical protein
MTEETSAGTFPFAHRRQALFLPEVRRINRSFWGKLLEKVSLHVQRCGVAGVAGKGTIPYRQIEELVVHSPPISKESEERVTSPT